MPANVRDLDAIRLFRAALLAFSEEAEAAYQGLLMETQRSVDWIQSDRPHYWRIQVQQAFDLVAATRTALNRCQIMTVAGHRKSCIEEKQAHRHAKMRLQHCQEQVERVKRWGIKLRHDVDEFRGRLAGLRRMLDSDIPKALALLDKTASVLEAYAEIPSSTQDEPT